MARIFIIDDDMAMDILKDGLVFRGHDAQRIASAADALARIDDLSTSDAIILDIIMPWALEASAAEIASGSAGMKVLRAIRSRNVNVPVVVYSATQDLSVIGALEDDARSKFLSKWEGHSIKTLIQTIEHLSGHKPRTPSIFIVHGQDESSKLALKNYLQNTLHLPEPVILHEQPNLGRTIIEKFEDYAAISSHVFVLMTPDDKVTPAAATDDEKRRARQNVIFEMGYFLGVLGRKSGRVILLYKKPLELPSDLSGVVYIDISNGIEAAGEEIRREVEHVK